MIKERKDVRLNARITKSDYDFLFELSKTTGYSLSKLVSMILAFYRNRIQ